MLLQTSIKPRRDGTVTVQGNGKNKDGTPVSFKFEPDENGDLVCDVTDQALVATLLNGEKFQPVNEEDFDAALKLANAAAKSDNGEGDGSGSDGEGDDEEDDEPVDENAAPIEGKGDSDEPPIDGAPAGAASPRRRRS